MEKYMKFQMYRKETKDRAYRENPYRAENFRIDENGTLRCLNGRAFVFGYRFPRCPVPVVPTIMQRWRISSVP